MKKHFSIFVLLFAFVYSAFAIQATQTPIQLTQSDGMIIMARLHGDEHFSFMTTLDGLLITKTSMGQYDYAVMANTGVVSSIGLKVSPENKSIAKNLLTQNSADFSKIAGAIIHDKLAAAEALYPRARRVPALGSMPARFPLKGDVKSIAILVNYTDVAFTVSNPQTEFTDLLNEEGYSKNGAIGSSRDYFIASSNGTFRPTFDVYGPVTLPHTQAYYGAKSGSDNDSHAREMIRDACNAADGIVNFKDYDIDGDGVCDNVFIYFAGHNEAEGGGSDCIWPHRSSMSGMNVSVDGVLIDDYACTSELRGTPTNTTMCGMATFSHEFGHVLGLVDYYDTQNSSNNEVPGSWNIMSSGNYNGGGSTPPSYCAQDRFFLGWLTPVQISDVSQILLEPLETSNTAYLMAASNSNMNGGSPDPHEYYLLSNRQYVGWDATSTCLPTHGLMISHVDFSASKWSNNSPNNDPDDKGYDIIRADGTYTNESGDLFPGSNGKYSSYNPVLKDKTDLGLPITQIIETGLNISFSVKGGDGTGLQVSSNAIEFVEPYSSTTGKLINTADKVLTVVITGEKLTEDVTIRLNRGRDYSYRMSDDEEYSTSTITLTKSDEDAVSGVLQIKFDPQIDPDCSTDYADAIYVTSGDYKSTVSLTASTQRELLITTPVITAVTDTSFSGFTLNWNAVDDAEGYYVTLQKKIEGGVHTTEDFTDFGTTSFDTNWDSNFSKFSNSATSSAPKSAWFSSTGNQLTTPVYTSTITTISFWMKPISSTEGSMTIEGYNGEEWTVLKVYDTSVLSARTYSIDLDASKGYIQFKITADIESGYGIAFDDFDAYAADGVQTLMNRNPVTGTSYAVTGLESGETYNCFVESYENKGCQLNISDPSETQIITTLVGGTTSNSNLSLMYDASASQYSVVIKNSKVGYGLNIYDVNGHLAAQIPVGVVAGSQSIALPLLDDDMFYVVVYCSVSDGPSSDDSSIKYVSNYH